MDCKSAAFGHAWFDPRILHQFQWASSLMVKRPTHNRLSSGSIPDWPTSHALLVQWIELESSKLRMVVRFHHRAPSFVRVSASEITLVRFLRRTKLVEGEGSIPWKSQQARTLDESLVMYRIPLEFITRVNGCYNDGATTLTNLMCTDAREAQGNWLQTSKAVSSNLTLYSKVM